MYKPLIASATRLLDALTELVKEATVAMKEQ